MFGEVEGFAYVIKESHLETADQILMMIAATVIDWQHQHPAINFGMNQDNYGLTAFKKFIILRKTLE